MPGISMHYMTYAFIFAYLFVISLFFGWTTLLIHMLIPRGTHRRVYSSRVRR
jgi:hypothetical protein